MNSYKELFTHIKSIVKTMKAVSLVIVVTLCVRAFAATPQVKNVKAFQQYPWGKVYISYEVVGDIAANAGSGKTPFLFVTAKDKTTGHLYGAVSSGESYLSGDLGTASGQHKIVWDVSAQGLTINSTNVAFMIVYCDEQPYCVIDLSSGANSSSYQVSYLYAAPSGGWADTYKTTKLVLRRIAAGTFKMQNTTNVTLTKPFYMGIFEVTQKQYQLVMGANPSSFSGDALPVEQVSYDMIRGTSNGAKWPSSSAVDSSSFIGKLRARTGLNFDLPTEAQWEYACRAGTTTTYYWGDSMNGNYAWYKGNSGNTTHKVGTKTPNAWGLYDMSGNVHEWCLDWHGALAYGTDPKGSASGSSREFRGGFWGNDAGYCTSSYRDYRTSSYVYYHNGFRLVGNLSD